MDSNTVPQGVKLVKFITPFIHAEPLYKWVFIVRVLSDRTLISAFKKIIALGDSWERLEVVRESGNAESNWFDSR